MPIYYYPNVVQSNSTQLPPGAASVVTDGVVTSASANGYATATITPKSNVVIITSGSNGLQMDIGGNKTYVPSNTTRTLNVAANYAHTMTVTAAGGTMTSSYTNNSMGYGGYYTTCAFGNNTFVTINNNNSSNCLYSTNNGSTWTLTSMPYQAYWSCVTFGNGIFVAIAGAASTHNYVATSPNGYTWTSYTNSSSTYWSSLAFGTNLSNGAGTWVDIAGYAQSQLGGSSTNSASYSTNNGQTWTASTLPSTVYWSCIAYGNGIWMAIAGEGSASNVLATTSNGYTWTQYTNNLGSYYWQGLAYGDPNGVPTWVMSTTSNQNVSAYSVSNGQRWTTTNGMSQSSYSGKSVFAGGYFINAYNNNNQGYSYNLNGVFANGWNLTNVSYQPTGIAYGNGFIVMSPNNNNSYATVVQMGSVLPLAFGVYNGSANTY